jgi:type IX secretion system PorP/SprF family membrane protein
LIRTFRYLGASKASFNGIFYMKRLLITGLLIISAQLVWAQQEPRWNHYMFNDFFYNPGVAGSRGAISTFLIHRYQWVNIPDDASPRTTNLSVHAPVKFLRGGLGMVITRDDEFFNRTTSFKFAYAYRTSLMGGDLGIGLYGGGIQSELDGAKFKPSNPNDPLLVTGVVQALAFDFGFGINYTHQDFYLNLSSNRLNNPKIRYNNTGSEITIDRNYFLSGGYNFPVGESFVITPSTLLKTNASAFQADLNVLATFKGQFWGGAGYSTGDAVIFMMGANIGTKWRIGYSYDYNLSGLSRFNDGSHEIFLGYDFNIVIPEKKQYIIRSPRFL